VVCINLIERKLSAKLVDDCLEQKGDKANFQGISIAQHEHCFILRNAYADTYLKFVQREDWYIQMSNTLNKRLWPDKSSKKQGSFATDVFEYSKKLIKELHKYFPQTNLNGTSNQWIVKPGGLSRGR
jgi:hypothetical protein